MENLPLFQASIHPNYDAGANLILHDGDVNQFLPQIPDESIHLIITSPPYNLGKEYENRVGIEHYLESQKHTLAELHRILADGGSLCWQVGNFVEAGEVYPLDILYYPIFKQLGFKLRNRIIWHFRHGLHASKPLCGSPKAIPIPSI